MKPILFNTEMVRAIQEGRKTVTRRVVKTKHKDACGFYVATRKSDGVVTGVYEYDENESMFDSPLEPPYQVNDILYVRETWRELIRPIGVPKEYAYKADEDKRLVDFLRWKPSIHMPKEAARIFLRVKDVRVERLRDMQLEDILAEGITLDRVQLKDPDQALYTAREKFKELWNSTCGKKGTPEYYAYSWYGNPFVWVIDFEVTDKPVE